MDKKEDNNDKEKTRQFLSNECGTENSKTTKLLVPELETKKQISVFSANNEKSEHKSKNILKENYALSTLSDPEKMKGVTVHVSSKPPRDITCENDNVFNVINNIPTNTCRTWEISNTNVSVLLSLKENSLHISLITPDKLEIKNDHMTYDTKMLKEYNSKTSKEEDKNTNSIKNDNSSICEIYEPKDADPKNTLDGDDKNVPEQTGQNVEKKCGSVDEEKLILLTGSGNQRAEDIFSSAEAASKIPKIKANIFTSGTVIVDTSKISKSIGKVVSGNRTTDSNSGSMEITPSLTRTLTTGTSNNNTTVGDLSTLTGSKNSTSSKTNTICENNIKSISTQGTLNIEKSNFINTIDSVVSEKMSSGSSPISSAGTISGNKLNTNNTNKLSASSILTDKTASSGFNSHIASKANESNENNASLKSASDVLSNNASTIKNKIGEVNSGKVIINHGFTMLNDTTNKIKYGMSSKSSVPTSDISRGTSYVPNSTISPNYRQLIYPTHNSGSTIVDTSNTKNTIDGTRNTPNMTIYTKYGYIINSTSNSRPMVVNTSNIRTSINRTINTPTSIMQTNYGQKTNLLSSPADTFNVRNTTDKIDNTPTSTVHTNYGHKINQATNSSSALIDTSNIRNAINGTGNSSTSTIHVNNGCRINSTSNSCYTLVDTSKTPIDGTDYIPTSIMDTNYNHKVNSTSTSALAVNEITNNRNAIHETVCRAQMIENCPSSPTENSRGNIDDLPSTSNTTTSNCSNRLNMNRALSGLEATANINENSPCQCTTHSIDGKLTPTLDSSSVDSFNIKNASDGTIIGNLTIDSGSTASMETTNKNKCDMSPRTSISTSGVSSNTNKTDSVVCGLRENCKTLTSTLYANNGCTNKSTFNSGISVPETSNAKNGVGKSVGAAAIIGTIPSTPNGNSRENVYDISVLNTNGYGEINCTGGGLSGSSATSYTHNNPCRCQSKTQLIYGNVMSTSDSASINTSSSKDINRTVSENLKIGKASTASTDTSSEHKFDMASKSSTSASEMYSSSNRFAGVHSGLKGINDTLTETMYSSYGHTINQTCNFGSTLVGKSDTNIKVGERVNTPTSPINTNYGCKCDLTSASGFTVVDRSNMNVIDGNVFKAPISGKGSTSTTGNRGNICDMCFQSNTTTADTSSGMKSIGVPGGSVEATNINYSICPCQFTTHTFYGNSNNLKPASDFSCVNRSSAAGAIYETISETLPISNTNTPISSTDTNKVNIFDKSYLYCTSTAETSGRRKSIDSNSGSAESCKTCNTFSPYQKTYGTYGNSYNASNSANAIETFPRLAEPVRNTDNDCCCQCTTHTFYGNSDDLTSLSNSLSPCAANTWSVVSGSSCGELTTGETTTLTDIANQNTLHMSSTLGTQAVNKKSVDLVSTINASTIDMSSLLNAIAIAVSESASVDKTSTSTTHTTKGNKVHMSSISSNPTVDVPSLLNAIAVAISGSMQPDRSTSTTYVATEGDNVSSKLSSLTVNDPYLLNVSDDSDSRVSEVENTSILATDTIDDNRKNISSVTHDLLASEISNLKSIERRPSSSTLSVTHAGCTSPKMICCRGSATSNPEMSTRKTCGCFSVLLKGNKNVSNEDIRNIKDDRNIDSHVDTKSGNTTKREIINCPPSKNGDKKKDNCSNKNERVDVPLSKSRNCTTDYILEQQTISYMKPDAKEAYSVESKRIKKCPQKTPHSRRKQSKN